MNDSRRQSGMTLVEMLVVLVIVLILIGATARMGQYVKTRASVQLAQSALNVIAAALEQYYTDNDNTFPPSVGSLDGFRAAIDDDGVVFDPGSGQMESDYWSSAALFFFLDRNPNSRSIVDALTGSLITNKDENGNDLLIQLSTEAYPRDFVRFIDPWGRSIRYYSGGAFPRVVSAGPDGDFNTPDDIENQ